MLCASFEALMGALYLDAGIDAVAEFMEPRLDEASEAVLEKELLVDARSILQMWAQSEIGSTPKYETVDSSGPDHAREFVVEVILSNGLRARGHGKSKQEAAQRAAQDALNQIGHVT